MQGAAVHIDGLSKSYGASLALSSVSLDIEAGEFLTLLGPSGCGKSTLLRLIAGFEQPDAGTIAIGGRNVAQLRPKERGLSMVFQGYALYPHMSVADNIATPLVMRQLGFWQRFPGIGRLMPGTAGKRRRITTKVAEVARLLELEPFLKRRPGQLSGGQRQRVALGRAIAPEPALFLMDEPLSNLDARLRIQMRNELTEMHRKLGITFIYVTHDQVEAMTMSHRIAVIMDGRLAQVGRPGEVYAEPATLSVARFIGTHPINLLPAKIDSAGMPVIFDQRLAMPVPGHAQAEVTLAIRPEDVSFADQRKKQPGQLLFDAVIEKIEDHGAELLVHCRPQADPAQRLAVRVDAARRHDLAGTGTGPLQLHIPAHRVLLFDKTGDRVATARAGALSEASP